jgi:hypothetical protein
MRWAAIEKGRIDLDAPKQTESFRPGPVPSVVIFFDGGSASFKARRAR